MENQQLTKTNENLKKTSLQILKASPKQFLTALNPQKIEDCLNSDSPCMAVIKTELGETTLKAMLTVLIIETVEFFNVGKTMGESQVAQTVELIIEDFGFMKPDDFKLCFKNAKRGLYGNGKLYDRIDGQIIFEWLNSYKTERMEASEMASIKKHTEYKKEDKHELTEEQRNNLKLLRENFTKWTKELDGIPKEKKPSPVVNLISIEEWKERFDKNKAAFEVSDLEKMKDDFKNYPEILKEIDMQIKKLTK